MLNKSNSEKSTCKYFNKSQNSSSNLITNSNSQKKSSSSKIKKSKLNTILNRTLSDSVLNKKSTYFSNPWHHHKKQTCLSRKNSTNRRSLIYNPNSTLFNQNFLYSNNSTNRISFYTSASAGPQSPSVFSNQSPVPNIFSNQNSIHNINQYNNLRNKLKQHRSSCCVVNNTSNNLSQQLDPYENNNFSLSSSICSSLSPSPITLVNRQNSLVLSTPPSNINLNFPTSSKNSQPVSSPLSLTPASALEQRKSINNVKQSSILVSSKSKRDSRRWSLASMHSSDCNTAMNTPKMISSLPPSFQQQSSSAVPSQYSSSTYLNDNIISNKKNLQNQKSYSDQSNIPLNSKNSSDSLKHCKSEENQIEYSQRLSFGGRRRRLSSSNESSHLDDSSDVGFSSPLSFHRQRARSLSCSPCKGLNDSDIAPTEKFKEKFPKACKQLEENLQLFIDLNKIDLNTSTFEYLHKFIKKFLFIISHVARLLECIEFDPLEFSHFLDCAEQQAKQQEIKTDIPKYIISKLGIDRDPIKELNNEEEVIHSLNRTNSLTSRTSTSGFSGDDFLPSDFSLTTNGSLKSESNAPVVAPSQDDFEEVKIISNGAYG
ncbi:unnamed protein product [Brachionus calyciflorus]|uniref:Microtubule-associated serine/threonine-protein kinase pre-PK domain-containing protein n=1 Tax=Brachionus calyciflorus TaxID=104777 RepID=A0A814GEC7_9BILA|nr:unnamed protein product [Brachionus calyciflorus]